MKILSAVAAIILFAAFGAAAETTNDLSGAEIQGRVLAQKILEQQPAQNLTNIGVLEIRDTNGIRTNISMNFSIDKAADNWSTRYICSEANFWQESLMIEHTQGQPNKYFHGASNGESNTVLPNDYSSPFDHSDFWLGDLGLEFFHWPAQKVLKKEVHRSRGCTVLESTNPNPSANGYSRVVSWIDDESLGIVEAYAYDANGKLLKDFYPKDFKKVDGQWQVQTLVMENVQTGSRSRLEFDLNKP